MADEPIAREELEKRHAAAMETVGTLQRKLDEELQRHVDKDAAHQGEVAKMLAESGATIESLKQQHAGVVQNLNDSCAALLKEQAAQMETRHAADIARLKAEILIPAQRDMHARQLADLQAKQAAELAKLQ